MLDHNTEDNNTEPDENTVIGTKKVNNKSDKKLLLRLQNSKKMMKFLMMKLPLPLENGNGY